METMSDSVAFSVPNFISTSEVTDLIKQPQSLTIDSEGLLSSVPLEYTRAIQNYQRTLRLKKAQVYQRCEKLYSHFASQNTVSLETLTQFVFDKSNPATPIEQHVTFLQLVSDNLHFMPSSNNVRATGEWCLRPEKEMKELQSTIDSIRTRDVTYTGFLERTRPILEFYNSHADPILGTLSQSDIEVAESMYKLVESDKKYINFIADWIRSPKVIVESPYEVFVPNMLKAFKVYDDLFIDRTIAIRFLQQVGMFKPHDNIKLVESNTITHQYLYSEQATENNIAMDRFSKQFLTGEAQGLYKKDLCDDIRHDFGNLAVYTIDDPTAKEIDDGVSIEKADDGNSAWLHVHIADPTVYIPPTHDIANLIQRRVQTLYLPECHFPMLPEELSSKKFSLGDTAQPVPGKDNAQYAMTFSARLDQRGDILEYKVRPSFIRNVVKIYYNDLDTLLKPRATIPSDPLFDKAKTYSHPNSLSFTKVKGNGTHVPKQHEKDLLDVFEFANRHADIRRQNGAINFLKPSPIIEIEPNPLDIPSIQFDKPHYTSTLPDIRLSLDQFAFSPARQTVAEMMMIGGRVASLYAAHNQVDIPFRTQTWKTKASNEEIARRQQLLDCRDPITGIVKFEDMVKYRDLFPPARVTVTPGLPHIMMGITDGYTKATSPLRRYMDCIVHWQLKSHLTQQKPFFHNRTALQTLATRLETQEKQLSFLQQQSTRFWAISLLNRLKTDGMDMEFRCMVSVPNRVAMTDLGGSMEVALGTLLDVGIQGRIERLTRSVEVGELVNVRITSMNALAGYVNFELV
ncbi:RNB-domain-containing protein [Backusella circina FSU 941]|nr:RNB-domain-containing protein [Backusella circina FSU 941]